MKRIGPRLEVRDLELVLALAASGSTIQAASKLHLTQSAISRALCLAEEKLGARLFERSRKGLAPTAAGRALIEGASGLLARWVELEREVLGGPKTAPLELRLVCECYTAYRWLPSALAALRAAVPGSEISIGVEHTGDPLRALETGEIDVALLTSAQLKKTSALRERPLFSDEIVFLVAPGHPLANKRTLKRADLLAHTLLTGNAPPGEARWFRKEVFGRAKVNADLIRFPLTEAIIDAARAGMGIAVMSEWIAEPYEGLLLKRLASGPLRRPWRIAFHQELTPAVEQLVRVLEVRAPRLAAVD